MQKKEKIDLKWVFDRSASLVGLVLISPVLLAIGIVIKAENPRLPVFFRQIRIGQFGRRFSLVKFRTMTPGDENVTITTSNDARVSKVGKFLRKNKLDELPQLWNVLKGDMSFVGPRPDVPGYADQLKGDDRIILMLKPGITCPATIKYRNEEKILALQPNSLEYNDKVLWPEKVRLNKEYALNHSFIGDLKIILRTLGILK